MTESVIIAFMHLCFVPWVSLSSLRLPLCVFQMILTVYLSDGEQTATEVPITPETTCRDVVEFCKEPGESGCHLAEVWRGNGEIRRKADLLSIKTCRVFLLSSDTFLL